MRLLLVLDILRKAKEDAGRLDETALEELEPTILACREKAETLREIFKNVVRHDDKWLNRYKEAVVMVSKGRKVEGLMEGIMEDIQVVICRKMIGMATEAQMNDIQAAIKEMHEITSSIHEASGPVNQTHHSTGSQFAHTGSGPQQTVLGPGSLYHISGSGYFGGKNEE